MSWSSRFWRAVEGDAAGGSGPETDIDHGEAVAGRTFPVSDVPAATEPLPELPYKEAVEALLQPGLPKHERQFRESMRRRAVESGQPWAGDGEPAAIAKVEACSRYHSRLLADVSYHPVVAAVHEAFAGHRPLQLSPDMIWLMIVQGVANHINAHAQELRPRLVRHEGRLDIEIRRDDFYKGSPENPWPEIFAQFSAAVSSHVGPASDLFRSEFSTTGPVERAVLDIVWLDAMQSFFNFRLRSRCGIPQITLEGSPGDWRTIVDRVEGFAGLGLDWWLDALRPILGQFATASRGEADNPFWRSIYRINGESGGPYVTGWIAAFFPYLKQDESESGCATTQNNYLLALREDPELAEAMLFPGDRPAMPVLEFPRGRRSYDRALMEKFMAEHPRISQPWRWGWTTASLPGGLSRAPFRWLHETNVFPMEFLGGFVGVRQCPDTRALRPEIGWAVRPTAGT